jgi:hypothetical protein
MSRQYQQQYQPQYQPQYPPQYQEQNQLSAERHAELQLANHKLKLSKIKQLELMEENNRQRLEQAEKQRELELIMREQMNQVDMVMQHIYTPTIKNEAKWVAEQRQLDTDINNLQNIIKQKRTNIETYRILRDHTIYEANTQAKDKHMVAKRNLDAYFHDNQFDLEAYKENMKTHNDDLKASLETNTATLNTIYNELSNTLENDIKNTESAITLKGNKKTKTNAEWNHELSLNDRFNLFTQGDLLNYASINRSNLYDCIGDKNGIILYSALACTYNDTPSTTKTIIYHLKHTPVRCGKITKPNYPLNLSTVHGAMATYETENEYAPLKRLTLHYTTDIREFDYYTNVCSGVALEIHPNYDFSVVDYNNLKLFYYLVPGYTGTLRDIKTLSRDCIISSIKSIHTQLEQYYEKYAICYMNIFTNNVLYNSTQDGTCIDVKLDPFGNGDKLNRSPFGEYRLNQKTYVELRTQEFCLVMLIFKLCNDRNCMNIKGDVQEAFMSLNTNPDYRYDMSLITRLKRYIHENWVELEYLVHKWPTDDESEPTSIISKVFNAVSDYLNTG